MLSRDYIEDLVKEGLVQDIFKMEQSYDLVKTIGAKTKDLNNGRLQVYNELFGTIQYALQSEALLAAARIYDLPSKKYPTRCLRGVLQYLSNNTPELPEIREPYQLTLHLKYMKAPRELIEIASSGSYLFAQSFSKYIENILNEPESLVAIEKLKTIRDKSIAHNEKSDNKIFGPTWGALKGLIEISKNVVGVLGWAYFSVAYVIEGEYILSNDAGRLSNSLNKLFETILKQ